MLSRTPPQDIDLKLRSLSQIASNKPAYIYRRSVIEKNISTFRAAFPDNINLHYSIKANPHSQLVSFIANLVDGLEVASHSEMLVAIGAGVHSTRITFSGPGKTDQELEAAIAANIVINIESVNELIRLLNISDSLGATPLVSVRINPTFAVKRSGMIMGGGSQPFGIDLEQVSDVFDLLRSNSILCHSLHCYVGSQMLDKNIIENVQSQILDMMSELIDKYSLTDVILNIGGGFGVPYFDNENEIDIQHIGNALEQKLSNMRHRSTVIVELGRYLVANSGIYLAKVIDKKISRGNVYLVVEGGLNHHLSATGNLGQVIQRNYPITSSSLHSEKEIVTVVGPLCTPLDILGKDVTLPVTDVGDYIAVHQSGAYGISASPNNFLGHPAPIEILID